MNYTLESFRPVYQKFLNSGKNVREFCSSESMLESKFYYWQSRLRKEEAQHTGSFMPVSINNRGGNRIVIDNTSRPLVNTPDKHVCEIIYPNGVTVRLSEVISPDVLKQLVLIS